MKMVHASLVFLRLLVIAVVLFGFGYALGRADESVAHSVHGDGIDAVAADVKHEVTDSWITTKVKSELLADSLTKGFDIKVVTTQGLVALSGKLPSKDALAHAERIAEKTEGVKGVDAKGLKVSSAKYATR